MNGRPWLQGRGNGRPPALSEQHAAARFWAARGLPVCRLISRDKRPTDRAPRTTGEGPEHRLATTDAHTIDTWWGETHSRWGRRAFCNLGLPTGRWPGVVALDVDDPPTFHAFLAGREIPPTLRWSSNRHDHPERHTMLFAYPPVDFAIRSLVDGHPHCVPGVDLRADGEHVVLPGSIHASGSLYTIQCDAPVAALPDWLVEELRGRFGQRSPSAQRPSSRIPDATVEDDVWAQAYASATRLLRRAAQQAPTASGQRHRMLVGLVWEGLARGLRSDDVRQIALVYVDRACLEPFDRTAARRQIEEALARPRHCQPSDPRFSVEGQARWLVARRASCSLSAGRGE